MSTITDLRVKWLKVFKTSDKQRIHNEKIEDHA